MSPCNSGRVAASRFGRTIAGTRARVGASFRNNRKGTRGGVLSRLGQELGVVLFKAAGPRRSRGVGLKGGSLLDTSGIIFFSRLLGASINSLGAVVSSERVNGVANTRGGRMRVRCRRRGGEGGRRVRLSSCCGRVVIHKLHSLRGGR